MTNTTSTTTPGGTSTGETPPRAHPLRNLWRVLLTLVCLAVVGALGFGAASYYYVGSGKQDSKILLSNITARIHAMTAPTKTELGKTEDELDSIPVRDADDAAAKRRAREVLEAKRREATAASTATASTATPDKKVADAPKPAPPAKIPEVGQNLPAATPEMVKRVEGAFAKY